MKRIFIVGLLCLGVMNAQEAVSQKSITLPARRTTFEAKAPTDIQLGKLWWDLGLFHPFTGEVSRDQWEKGFFPLMNKSVQPGADIAVLAAEALALLKDPASLLLESGEGKGDHFLPIIWEVKDGKARIIGGDKAQITEPLGPVDQVGGRPIKDFLARRLGSFQSDDRIYAALTLASRRGAAFAMDFAAGGAKVTIKSVSDLKTLKGAWIQGGWKGRTILELDGFKIPNLEAAKTLAPLDLRAANWVSVGEASGIEELVMYLGAQSVPKEVVRLAREHRGQYDEDWDRYAHDSSSYNRIVAMPSPNRMAYINGTATSVVALPQVVLDSRLAEVLAGWALPAALNVCARETQYAFGSDLQVRLRLESWSGSLADAKNQATYQNGGLLTVDAAKALAAATIIEYDHLFAFTPEAIQEGVFKRALEARVAALDVEDLVLRSGGVTKDSHTTTFTRGLIKNPWEATLAPVLAQAPWAVQPVPYLPAYETSTGEIRLLRSISKVATAGAVIESVKGVPLADLVKSVRPLTWARPDQRDVVTDFGHIAIGGKFGKPVQTTDGSNSGPSEVVVVEGGKKKTVKLRGWWIFDSQYEPFTPPSGWEIAKTGGAAPTIADITKALEAGKKIIIDARRARCLNVEAGWKLPAPYPTPSQSGYRRTPDAPFAWGTDPVDGGPWMAQSETTFAVRGYIQNGPSMTKALPGSLVILVCGVSASHLELAATFLKEAFPLNTKIVGLPTAGTMGVRTRLFLPVGGGDNSVVYYTPTVSLMTIGGHNYNYIGLPLDHKVSEDELLKEMAAGSPDPLLSAALKGIGIN